MEGEDFYQLDELEFLSNDTSDDEYIDASDDIYDGA